MTERHTHKVGKQERRRQIWVYKQKDGVCACVQEGETNRGSSQRDSKLQWPIASHLLPVFLDKQVE